ncbi:MULTISPECIES: MarR family winged helix-turn-helix transcriptional regulator [Pedobacter]|jgi:DNA-binding MarR family transcriptional regulator|uniref:Regulatory protein MarR n=1 Tax=Pedobacter heparinus (strain ATCC 13125 / DSM 2366 / CIP 104194 / JCM 7457 / NBRC 12017 / NCIMB 9290 / NRRL B-14731 / HIM 762-3) TaxID=485917 RepID=C6XX05_PEDHD|nr:MULTISPECIES: helix-turn-helix domain-containing protein [Pedobacter]ACU04299.1 regulatory protein MarR [Pedobacter heparinus DSM 2366]MBB5440431.1 DNA-binding MarR family transcriptional regulator [Pedobacter sp. AK017]
MKYDILKNVIHLLEEFESENFSGKTYPNDIEGFKRWVVVNYKSAEIDNEPNWEGKEKGRSAESVINTLIVHLNRYAKSYSKSAISGSNFSTQEEFIYLINLKAFGEMTKMDLIKKNVHEKPAGMQIINRLIAQGWVDQTDSETDKRSKVLKISNEGIKVLENQMGKIRKATEVVTGDLTRKEKMELIRLLNKLNDFHQPIYDKNIEPEYLLNEVLKNKR